MYEWISELKSLAGVGISSLLLLAIQMYRVTHFAVYGENEMQSFLSNAIVYLKRIFYFMPSSLPLFDNRKHTFFQRSLSKRSRQQSTNHKMSCREKNKEIGETLGCSER